jgi:dynein heavy chain
MDSLQAQMLAMVVMNERSDLENTFADNQKEAFESISSLKEIEKVILVQLEMEVNELLSDENLIRILNESKNTAEYVASKLKNISVTNLFIQKSRNVYAPVAYRAAVLYFIAQDLQKVNNMYVFSLNWFKEIF